MDREKHEAQSFGRQTIPATSTDTLHSQPAQSQETLVADVLSSCSSSNSCNESQPPIILSSDICELTSKYEGEALIKVDSMLAEPCKYLEGVSVFGVDDDENTHQGLVDGGIEQSKSVALLKGSCGSNSKKLLVGSENGDQALAGVVSQGNAEECKGSRMNLLDPSPFLLNEEGVVFQCFPVSEKEVFIVSLEEEALLMNEQLAEESLSIAPNNTSESNAIVNNTGKQVGQMVGNIDGGSQYSILGASETESYLHDIPTSSIMSKAFHESDGNFELQGSKAHLKEIDDHSVDLVCQSESLPANTANCIFSSEKEIVNSAPGDDGYQKELKVTHATIFAPPVLPHPPRRMKKGPSDGGEAVVELYKCSICHEALPTSGTLRHHLITRHQQSNLDSFMCFLCKQDCWSSNQQNWHLRIQHGIKNKTLACLVCGTQFTTATEHRAHVRKHSANLTCPSCPKKFASQYLLTDHVKQHLEELQPFNCELCSIRFSHSKILEIHGWRHRSQDCPEESCNYVAEDESWLLHHLQDHHKQSAQSAYSLTSSRNADEYKMDILLMKYFQVQNHRLDTPPCRPQSPKKGQGKGCSSVVTSTPCVDIKKQDEITLSLKDQTDSTEEGSDDLCSQILGDMVEAVVAIDDEEKKNIRRKEEVLRKVFDGGTSSYRCGLCNTYHASAEELAIHKAEHNQVLECVKCQKSFLSIKQLKRHMTVHSLCKDDEKQANKGMNEHPCLLCGKVFGSESALSRHSSTHARSEGRHQCKVCFRRVGTRAHLAEHMSRVHKIHNDSKKMQCPMCDRRFVSSFHLNLHLITHGEVKPLYSCKVCNRNYIRPRSLRRHMTTHDQNFMCKICNESFPSARRLSIHSRTHDPSHKKKVQCPKCPMAFPYKSQLEVHLRTHTGEKPYVCETCGKSFKRLQHCTVHLRVMHSNEKHPCKECGKLFSDKTNLLRHRLKVHYHLNRWVCGVCAQSFAYSEDLRRHLKKKHSLTFDRLVSANKKCMNEVYVIPELGTREISANTRAAIECICEMERQKVKQIFSGGVPDLTKTLSESNTSDSNKNEDPDDPSPQQGNSVAAGSVCIPTTAVVPTLMGNGPLPSVGQSGVNLQTCYGTSEVSGLVPLPITGVKCIECGIDVVSPQQCGVCGVLLCSPTHLDSHTACVHQVLFQCSVCGQHYNSQSECITHVTTCHSSHLLTVQGTTTSYLQAGQAHALQSSGTVVQPQLCLPLSNSPSNPQCILQVGNCPPQLPVLVAPPSTAVGSQQLSVSNCVLPYTSVVNGWSQATSFGPAGAIGKQTVYAMTNIFADQQSMPNIQSSASHMKKEPVVESPLCTITVPSENSENLTTRSVGMISSKPCSSMLPTILPHVNSSVEVPQLLAESSELNEHHDENTQLLLVDSGINPSNTHEVPHSAVRHEKILQPSSAHHQTSTSVASVLLTLAETPQDDQASMLVPSSGLRIPSGHIDQVLSPSIVSDVSLNEVAKESTTNAGNTDFLQSIHMPQDHKDELVNNPSFSLSQVAEDTRETKSPEAISVEIIQPQMVKQKLEQIPKSLPKKSSRTKRKKPVCGGGMETYECKACGKVLSSNSQLKRHEATHGVRRFKCQVCGKAFTEKYNLKIHMLIHTQERPHECTLCKKTFRYLRDLAEHKRTHEGTRPYICDVCQKTFVRQRDLSRHEREQHDSKRYQCKMCGLFFKRRLYLNSVHMKIHHPLLIEASEEEQSAKQTARSKPEVKQSHICKICGKKFARARYLTSHLRTHSKRASYVRCPMCPRMFITEQTLKVHQQTFHNHEPRSTAAVNEQMGFEGNVQENIAVNFDSSHTENLVISESQDMSENTSPLIISSQNTEMQTHVTKQQLLLPSNTSDSSAQQPSYPVIGNNESLEASLRTGRIGHFDVNIDECDPITYLTPSFTS